MYGRLGAALIGALALAAALTGPPASAQVTINTYDGRPVVDSNPLPVKTISSTDGTQPGGAAGYSLTTAAAQSASMPSTGIAGPFDTTGYTIMSFDVAVGTGATWIVEGSSVSSAGTNWQPVAGYYVGSVGAAPDRTGDSASGTFVVPLTVKYVRVRQSAISSGTTTVIPTFKTGSLAPRSVYATVVASDGYQPGGTTGYSLTATAAAGASMPSTGIAGPFDTTGYSAANFDISVGTGATWVVEGSSSSTASSGWQPVAGRYTSSIGATADRTGDSASGSITVPAEARYLRVRQMAITSGTTTVVPTLRTGAAAPRSVLATPVDGYQPCGTTGCSVSSAATLITQDMTGYGSVSMQIAANAGGNTVAFEVSNDNTTWLPKVGNISTATGTGADGTSTTSASTMFEFTVPEKWFRARVSTYVSGTTTVVPTLKAVAAPPRSFYVAGSANLGTFGAVSVSSGGVSSSSRIQSTLATTNTTIAKATTGRVYKITGYNTTGTPVYIKLHNATSVTCGTTTVATSRALPSGAFSFDWGDIGYYMSTGIGYCLTMGAADNDNTAPGAGAITALEVAYQ